jgi:hypothetical protein
MRRWQQGDTEVSVVYQQKQCSLAAVWLQQQLPHTVLVVTILLQFTALNSACASCTQQLPA